VSFSAPSTAFSVRLQHSSVAQQFVVAESSEDESLLVKLVEGHA
jgi:hypothetical protein